MLLVVSMALTLLPVSAMAAYGGWGSWGFDWSDLWNWGEDDAQDDGLTGLTADNAVQADTVDNSNFMRIFHLDCGRKYFSVTNIKKLIDTMAQYGYNQLQLAFGNDGFRFLLDNMSLTFQDGNGVNVELESEAVKENIKNGNISYCGNKVRILFCR